MASRVISFRLDESQQQKFDAAIIEHNKADAKELLLHLIEIKDPVKLSVISQDTVNTITDEALKNKISALLKIHSTDNINDLLKKLFNHFQRFYTIKFPGL